MKQTTVQKRTFHYIYEKEIQKSDLDDLENVQYQIKFKKKEMELESEDTFEEELLLLGFPIEFLNNVDTILRSFGLRDDVFYFYKECKDVLSYPEKHINAKGEGKLDFQSFFHNIPYSVVSINDTAIVVVALRVSKEKAFNKEGLDYQLAGYIHAVRYSFHNQVKGGKEEKGYYFNMLRVSEKMENGKKIYRRKKIFSMFFAIALELGAMEGMNYSYAAMGKENDAITSALERSCNYHDKHFEFLSFKVYAKVNLIHGSRRYAKQIINITQDKERLSEMYQMVKETYSPFMFFNLFDEAKFLNMVKQITAYSKSSGVYMIADDQGKMQAASFGVNWGDYFSFLMQNPKGILKLIDRLKLTEKILYPILNVGKPAAFDKLLKGMIRHYRKEENVNLTFLSSFDGDPLQSVKKSFIHDDYLYFIIARYEEELQAMKKASALTGVPVRMFFDQPLL